MDQATTQKNKIEEALQEAMQFLKQFYFTYTGLLLKPVKFFSRNYHPVLKPAVFAFISCFLFSIFIAHFSLYIPGLGSDQDVSYFLDHPASYIEDIRHAIEDFSFIKTFIRCFLTLGTMYIFSRGATYLFKSSPEKEFSYRFCMYYSGWQLTSVFLILVLVSLYCIEFPFSNSIRKVPIFGGAILALIEFIYLTVFLLPVFLIPIIAMLRIRRKAPVKKYYFRMTVVAILVYLPFILNVGLAGHLANIRGGLEKNTSPFFYYKGSFPPLAVLDYNNDSLLIKARVVVVNPGALPLFVDPLYAAEIDVESSGMQGGIDSITKKMIFDYRFCVTGANGGSDLISIDPNKERLLNLQLTIAKKDFYQWYALQQQHKEMVYSLYVITEDIAEEDKRRVIGGLLIPEANRTSISWGQLKLPDSTQAHAAPLHR